MSTVIFNEYTSITLRGDIEDSSKDNKASRTREFRVVSGSGLAPYQLIEFADTLRELGAHEREARNFRLSVTQDPGTGPTRLTAEWKVDLPAEVE